MARLAAKGTPTPVGLLFAALCSVVSSGCGQPAAEALTPQSAPPAPLLFVEHDPDGAAFLRVQEGSRDPFAPAGPARKIADRSMGPAAGTNLVIDGSEPTSLSRVTVRQMKHGLTLQGSGTVSIYDYTYDVFDGGGSIHGAAIKVGDNGRPTSGPTYIERVVGDGGQKPDGSYKARNTDFLGIETDSGPVFVRNVTGRNFSDAGVDTKSSRVYIMNATLDGAHRMVRAWPGVEIILVNSIVNAAPDHMQGWVADDTASVRYHNTLWCLDADEPSGASRDCRSDPWLVEGEDMSRSAAAARFIALKSSPLPEISPFFATRMEAITVEYSANAGRSWKALALQNAGKTGSAPVGDLRYRIPLDLSAADYRFRASYTSGGETSETSSVIDERGGSAPE